MDIDKKSLQLKALNEFESFVTVLRNVGVRVRDFDDTLEPQTPDALFPNNWISFHADGNAVLYPMLANNRRLERRADILDTMQTRLGFQISNVIDLAVHENHARYLEGTGSLVLDRVHRIAYACLSPRTHVDVLAEFSQCLNYELVVFQAFDAAAIPIYHTNVLMSIGTKFAAICAAAICDKDRERVLDRLKAQGRCIVEISREQMHHFAGNILELKTSKGEPVVAISARAHGSLSQSQREQIEEYAGSFVAASIPTIETFGGGSVRCMLAEIHLPRVNL